MREIRAFDCRSDRLYEGGCPGVKCRKRKARSRLWRDPLGDRGEARSCRKDRQSVGRLFHRQVLPPISDLYLIHYCL